MIDTSYGKIDFRSPWLNTKEFGVRGPLKDEIAFQTDGSNGILRRKPRVLIRSSNFTYQENDIQ